MAPDSIRAGEQFSVAIDRGLISSDVFVVLITPAALLSNFVAAEVNAAIDRSFAHGLEVIPLEVGSAVVPPLLSTFQRVPFDDYTAGLSQLSDELGIVLTPQPTRTAHEQPSDATATTGRSTDEFLAAVIFDLDRGARIHGYTVQRTPKDVDSALDIIVEQVLLRIGVMVRADHEGSVAHHLAAAEQELRSNPHRVTGILLVAPSDTTRLTPYGLLDAPSPNTVLMEWNMSDGADAVGAGVRLVAQILTGEAPR